MRNIPFAGIELTSQRGRGLRGTSELARRPVLTIQHIIKKVVIIYDVKQVRNSAGDGTNIKYILL